MLRKILFQAHWLVGIIAGLVLAFSGLTGGLLAFGPELTDWANGGYTRIEPAGATALPAAELYARAHAAYPGRRITDITTWSDTTRPARVRIAAENSFMGPTSPIDEIRMMNPYSGELLPTHPFGQKLAWFMHWLREVHQGHWGGPQNPFGRFAASAIGIATVLLFAMALSGLYLRWPRGVAARKLGSWVRVNWRLKGRAFLFGLHSVVGTFALLFYLVSAHTGAFQSSGVRWYGSGVRSVLGLPQQPHFGGPGGPPGAPPGPGGPGRDPNSVRLIAMHADGYFSAEGDAENATTSMLDTTTRSIREAAERPEGTGFGAALAANNQLLHEGRYFGRIGVLLMMLASLAMPVFYVTGWMMYLKRPQLKRAVA